MHKIVSCVVRQFKGQSELVQIEDATNLVIGERVLTGRMADSHILSGPSRTHQVRVWLPLDELNETRYGYLEVNDCLALTRLSPLPGIALSGMKQAATSCSEEWEMLLTEFDGVYDEKDHAVSIYAMDT